MCLIASTVSKKYNKNNNINVKFVYQDRHTLAIHFFVQLCCGNSLVNLDPGLVIQEVEVTSIGLKHFSVTIS